ncbi:class I SAM-dependent methyltransferase [Salaquimonas pukyongi]|uniref:class I SAM-dependent methyltransferase n=1 Tax=Salaquimonas pukyongi TaxID=2712698 RepID=UPI00096BBD01|nr:class I SAM-dependent methyltransferase [Salaquimonas pukyongi]
MSVDVVDLREFYATPLGHRAVASMVSALQRNGGLPADIDVVGLGYPVPVFNKLLKTTDKAVILMPARQGAVQWPLGTAGRTALVDDDELPLATSSVQCAVLLHVLENTFDPSLVLDEVWRVLVPEGKLILIATNRRGLWTRFEHTPFGNGRPFSRGQLATLLRKARLTPSKWDGCLDFPPIRIAWMLRLYPFIERIGRKIWPVFCGAHVVTASKRLYQGIPAKARKARKVPVPVLAPQGARIGQRARPSARTEKRAIAGSGHRLR